MDYTIKLAIVGIALLFLTVGILIGHMSTYVTLRSMRNKEEYLFNLRIKHETDTVAIIAQAATGPGIPGTEGNSPLRSPLLQLPIPPTGPAHRRVEPSLLARRQFYPLHTPDPSAPTQAWGMLPVQPVSSGG
jgi:hypothetical protein